VTVGHSCKLQAASLTHMHHDAWHRTSLRQTGRTPGQGKRDCCSLPSLEIHRIDLATPADRRFASTI